MNGAEGRGTHSGPIGGNRLKKSWEIYINFDYPKISNNFQSFTKKQGSHVSLISFNHIFNFSDITIFDLLNFLGNNYEEFWNWIMYILLKILWYAQNYNRYGFTRPST